MECGQLLLFCLVLIYRFIERIMARNMISFFLVDCYCGRYGRGYKNPFNSQARLPDLYRVPLPTPADQWEQLWQSIPFLAVDIPPQVRLSRWSAEENFTILFTGTGGRVPVRLHGEAGGHDQPGPDVGPAPAFLARRP